METTKDTKQSKDAKNCQNNRIVSSMLNNKHTTKTLWPSVGKNIPEI